MLGCETPGGSRRRRRPSPRPDLKGCADPAGTRTPLSGAGLIVSIEPRMRQCGLIPVACALTAHKGKAGHRQCALNMGPLGNETTGSPCLVSNSDKFPSWPRAYFAELSSAVPHRILKP